MSHKVDEPTSNASPILVLRVCSLKGGFLDRATGLTSWSATAPLAGIEFQLSDS